MAVFRPLLCQSALVQKTPKCGLAAPPCCHMGDGNHVAAASRTRKHSMGWFGRPAQQGRAHLSELLRPPRLACAR
jgi:hypothetical protein